MMIYEIVIITNVALILFGLVVNIVGYYNTDYVPLYTYIYKHQSLKQTKSVRAMFAFAGSFMVLIIVVSLLDKLAIGSNDTTHSSIYIFSLGTLIYLLLSTTFRRTIYHN